MELKHPMHDYHLPIPRTTKTIEVKVVYNDTNEELADGFNNVEYTGNVVEYNSITTLYQIEHEGGDQEELYCYEVQAHKDIKVSPSPMEFKEYIEESHINDINPNMFMKTLAIWSSRGCKYTPYICNSTTTTCIHTKCGYRLS